MNEKVCKLHIIHAEYKYTHVIGYSVPTYLHKEGNTFGA
jgi:hypothetical protein